jgi:hypothetical protein
MIPSETPKAPTLVDELRARGVRGVLVQMAMAGQIIELRCEMPYCYCPHGRRHFVKKKTPPPRWAPSQDHYPHSSPMADTLTPGMSGSRTYCATT